MIAPRNANRGTADHLTARFGGALNQWLLGTEFLLLCPGRGQVASGELTGVKRSSNVSIWKGLGVSNCIASLLASAWSFLGKPLGERNERIVPVPCPAGTRLLPALRPEKATAEGAFSGTVTHAPGDFGERGECDTLCGCRRGSGVLPRRCLAGGIERDGGNAIRIPIRRIAAAVYRDRGNCWGNAFLQLYDLEAVLLWLTCLHNRTPSRTGMNKGKWLRTVHRAEEQTAVLDKRCRRPLHGMSGPVRAGAARQLLAECLTAQARNPAEPAGLRRDVLAEGRQPLRFTGSGQAARGPRG